MDESGCRFRRLQFTSRRETRASAAWRQYGIVRLRRDFQVSTYLLERLSSFAEDRVNHNSDRYHYLLQAEPDLISLDDYVFTTGQFPIRHATKIETLINFARLMQRPTLSSLDPVSKQDHKDSGGVQMMQMRVSATAEEVPTRN